MKDHNKAFQMVRAILIASLMFAGSQSAHAVTPIQYQAVPIVGAKSIPPLVMLVMGRDHKLYYEAYNDASDLDGDGQLDIRYNPAIEYYGYFDSYKYYEYVAGNKRFEAVGPTINGKEKPAGAYWSGDYLNYLTMSRIDTVRKVLYGGYRSTDTADRTVLERAYIPNDAHCWGKEYLDIATDGYDISKYTPFSLPAAGKRHLFASGSLVAPGAATYAPLLRVKLNSDKRIWTWVSAESGTGIMGDTLVGAPEHQYEVRVLVCDSASPEGNCKQYPDGNYKPTGLLQRYGESERMYFGLLTASYGNHLSGGALRKNIGPISDEINPDTGQFKYKSDASIKGIVKTIDNFRIIGFNHGTHYWDQTIYSRPINEGENYMWGNPVAEMMYESLRYFAGAEKTNRFSTLVSDGNDRGLNLPLEAWQDPYGTYPACAKPVMLVISDINPSYDTNQLPGVDGNFNDGFVENFGALNVASGLAPISANEGISGNKYYIGQSGGSFDTACSGKTVAGLSSIRGLCPEEPTKAGGYYAASVAHYGQITDLNIVEGDQKVDTYAVGLASPLPRIEIPMANGKIVTLVPLAKSIYSASGGGVEPCRPDSGECVKDFQPTCAMVDFYVEELSADHGKFRVSYEHAEQGSDFDMDAIITYEYTKQPDGSLDIHIESANVNGGSTKQHFGYIISGTDDDGVYMEIKNASQPNNEDKDFYLDTPPGIGPNQGVADRAWEDHTFLPNSTTRNFTTGNAPAATLLKDPLFYAGKYGGFKDQNDNDIPDLETEWDTNHDGIPDNYFYVTNPLRLEAQLNASFAQIAAKSASGTSASVLATTNEGEGTLIQAYFRPVTATGTDEVRWMGYLQSLWVDSQGLIREDTNGNQRLDLSEDKVLVFKLINGESKVRRYNVTVAQQYPDLDADGYFTVEMDDILPIWEAGRVLADTDSSDRNILTSALNGSLIPFADGNLDSIKSMLGVSNADIALFPDANINLLGPDLDFRARRLINYVRGVDAPGLRNRAIDGKQWKLGDIVYSTPVSVSKPVEQYHIIYSDRSYGAYVEAHKNRQTVVYAGGNDGMLHAFTSWRFNRGTNTFEEPVEKYGAQGFTIGDELWSYIPRAVLPHLKWLSDPDYYHSYYVDSTPRIFDAKIAGVGQNEWGTFLLLGLNMGGKDIPVDADADGNTETFKPSYTLLDITNPTSPKLVWERTYEGLGMSRSVPSIIKIGGDHFKQNDVRVPTGRPERWLAVFGSGPQGDLAYQGISDQPGRVYVVDLKTGDPTGAGGNDYLFTLSDNSVVNSPVALDKGLNFEVNAIYLGESIKADPADPHSAWTGKAWTIDTYENWDGVNANGDRDPDWWEVTNDPTVWHHHLLAEEFKPLPAGPMMKLGPITAPMALSLDMDDNVWVYFGTGRYVSEADKTDAAPQHLFGMKDPLFHNAREYSFDGYVAGAAQGIGAEKLLNASLYRVKKDRTIEAYGGGAWGEIGNWDDLLKLVRQNNGILPDGTVDVDNDWLDGWSRNLEISEDVPPLPSERCISKFSVLGGAVFVPAYTPSDDVCHFGGTSILYGLYFETGTAFYKPLLPPNAGEIMEETKALGEGAPPPIGGIHIGREKGGKAFLQMSTGEIIEADVDPAFPFKSRMVDWFD